MKALEIQHATLHHEPVILEFAKAFHEEDGHPLKSTSPAAIRALLSGSPLGEIYLAKVAGVEAGYFALCFTMSLEFGGLVVILDDLYLAPTFRGQGFGQKLLDRICQLAKAKGAVQIFLEVERANQKAKAIYLARGFRVRERHMLELNQFG